MNNTGLKKKNKSLLLQAGLLAAVCIAIAMIGRFTYGNRFHVAYQINHLDTPPNPAEIDIRWSQEGMHVEKREVMNHDLLPMDMRAQRPGEYELEIYDKEDNFLMYDRLHVGRFGTTYSEMTGNFTGDLAVFGAITLFFVGLAVINLVFFVRLRGPYMYSYLAIISCGIGLFCSLSGLMLLNMFLRRLVQADEYWMREVYSVISHSGENFMLLTSPLVLVFSLQMIISNMALLRHESFRVQNVLGIGIGLFLIAATGLGFWMITRSFAGSVDELRVFNTVHSVFGIVYSYCECILMAAVICGIRAAKHVPAGNQDYILILGCGFRKDGTLPPLIRGRVDKAIEFWKKQKEETGKEAVLIPSGGQGSNEPMAEAEAMSRYLLECGIPENVIMKEDKSANTYQNMEFSKNLIQKREGTSDKNTIFVTTNYHVFRSGVWAGLADLKAEGLGSRTKWWFWPNAFVRECVGLFVNRWKQETFWLIITTLVFAGLTILTSPR